MARGCLWQIPIGAIECQVLPTKKSLFHPCHSLAKVSPVKLKPFKTVPLFVAFGVIATVWGIRLLKIPAIEELECKSYDWRVRLAAKYPSQIATNLGFVFIQDATIDKVNDGSLGYSFGLKWPRQVYARVVHELSAQGAKAVGFDVLFSDLRHDHPATLIQTNIFPDITDFLSVLHSEKPATAEDGRLSVESDEFLAYALNKSGRVILAAEKNVRPHELFQTNAIAIADISTDKDSDGVLRRARAFTEYREWHKVFKSAAKEYGFDLANAKVFRDRIVLRTPDGQEITAPLNKDGNFDLADFLGDKIPQGWSRFAKPFTTERIWHMGIVLAAQELKLDLARAKIDLRKGKIVLRGGNGIERVIPVDANGNFYVDWGLRASDRRFMSQPFELLLEQYNARPEGEAIPPTWTNRIIVVGSVATGNELTDRGATPLAKDTALVSKHWNVANSVITGKFVSRTTLLMDLAMILLVGVLTAALTWQMRALSGLAAVLITALLYTALCCWLFIQFRVWLPIALPVGGAGLVMFVLLETWRVVFEQAEKRHVKNIFSRLVSPNVVNELLGVENLSLEGTPREVTVLFADIRGFTQLTDDNRARAVTYVREKGLSGAEAEAVYEEQARDTLSTVNLYLALVADMVKKHNGTLDKYIGDCVMAFWGAPTPDQHHAASCVRAAVDAQRAIDALNRRRTDENVKRQQENYERAASGLDPLTPLPLLQLGSGINSGIVTVGLMGSTAHIFNYTVFGREVNLASRLEGVSGRGRVVISEATYTQLQTNDPDLAALCVPLESVTVKGIRDAVKIYEVPWRDGAVSVAEASSAAAAHA
jgi:class 3 adenylate cyclase/CHASE2 domain-containing sensor protein